MALSRSSSIWYTLAKYLLHYNDNNNNYNYNSNRHCSFALPQGPTGTAIWHTAICHMALPRGTLPPALLVQARHALTQGSR